MTAERAASHQDRDFSTPSRFMIGSGGQGTVMLDTGTMVVQKRFFSMDGNEAGEMAASEFEYLSRYQRVLGGEPYLACPTPLSVERESGILTMSYCPGVSLDDVLATPRTEVDDHLAHISSLICTAAELYVQEFGEPYFDLGHHNMLYDAATASLSLIDFATMGEIRRSYRSWHDPMSFTLGNFFGTSVYHTVRPATWNNRLYWRRVEWLSKDVLSRVGKRREISAPVVRDISNCAYRVWAYNGTPARRLWYSTVGRALYRKRLGKVITHIRVSRA